MLTDTPDRKESQVQIAISGLTSSEMDDNLATKSFKKRQLPPSLRRRCHDMGVNDVIFSHNGPDESEFLQDSQHRYHGWYEMVVPLPQRRAFADCEKIRFDSGTLESFYRIVENMNRSADVEHLTIIPDVLAEKSEDGVGRKKCGHRDRVQEFVERSDEPWRAATTFPPGGANSWNAHVRQLATDHESAQPPLEAE